MKICMLSDTHTYHKQVEMPEAEVVIHCGDYTHTGETHEVIDFLNWFGNQKSMYKIFINGNHEKYVAKMGITKQMVESHNKYHMTNIIYLEDSEVVIDGIKFYGSPWTPEFFPEHWAYQLMNDGHADSVWRKIPNDVDVLITHGPVFGKLDKVKPFARYDKENAGCPVLLKKILEIKPKIHVAGHIHSGNGVIQGVNTLFINASMCNEAYKVNGSPYIVTIDELTKKTTLIS